MINAILPIKLRGFMRNPKYKTTPKNKIPILIHEKYTESELVEIKTIINDENV